MGLPLIAHPRSLLPHGDQLPQQARDRVKISGLGARLLAAATGSPLVADHGQRHGALGALFDGFAWTCGQTTKGLLQPNVAA